MRSRCPEQTAKASRTPNEFEHEAFEHEAFEHEAFVHEQVRACLADFMALVGRGNRNPDRRHGSRPA